MGVLIPHDPTGPSTLTCTFDLTQPEVQQTIVKLKTLLGRLAQHRKQQGQQRAQLAADELTAQLGGRLVIGGGESSRRRSTHLSASSMTPTQSNPPIHLPVPEGVRVRHMHHILPCIAPDS